MKQQYLNHVVEVDTLQNLVEWFSHNFICGERPSNVKALYVFANKVDTPMDQDGNTSYSKFENEDDAEKFFEALEHTRFIIESELVDQDAIRNDELGEIIHVVETWKITATPSMSNTIDKFVAYCPRPYHVIRPFEN